MPIMSVNSVPAGKDKQKVQIEGVDGNAAAINENGEINVVSKGLLCSSNSTSDHLGSGGVFTGEWQDTIDYGFIIVGINSDVASATDGLRVEWSADGSTVHDSDVYSIGAGAGKVFTYTPARRYFRIKYTNGATGTSSFNIQSVMKKTGVKGSSHRIQDSIVDEDDAELVKAVITGENGGGVFKNVQVTSDGNLSISDNSSGLSIAQGNVTGVSFIHKFGEAPDFDTSDNEVTMWDGANDGLLGGGAMSYTYSTTADIGIISSSNASDTQDIEIQGLDTNGDIITQTFTLNGQTDVDLSATGSDYKRVFRMKNVGSTDLAGVVYMRTNGSAQSGGVPTTANTVRAMINDGNNQTLMAVYTIPTGYTGYMRDWYASAAGGSRVTNYKIKLKARKPGEVFQLKHTTAIDGDATSYIQHRYNEPEVFSAGTDIEMTVQATEAAITASDVAGGFDIVLVAD